MANEVKVVSFNVNGLRARLHQLAAVIDKHQPDIIALQETKVVDEEFPQTAIEELGYHAEINGQKGHYGVALLSREKPLETFKGFSDADQSAQKRLIGARYRFNGEKVEVINGYFPQGESRLHPDKFPHKRNFYQDLTRLLSEGRSPELPLLVVGDMNVAPEEKDIGIGVENAKRWLRTGKCCFLPEEREWLQTLCQWGLSDTYRAHHPDTTDRYSWFDYRSRGFMQEPKRGLRIDFILATETLLGRCHATGIDYQLRGMEKPSDHCPVWATFKL